MTAPAPEQQPAADWQGTAPPRPGPAAGLQYAGFWVRVVALILDAIVLGVLSAVISPFLGDPQPVDIGGQGMEFEVNYTANAVSTLIGLVYFIGFWAWRGQTPGMMPFNMRVVRADDGGDVDWVRALLRYVGLLISFVVILIGVIWVAFDSRKQGWHDKIAGTVVVRPT